MEKLNSASHILKPKAKTARKRGRLSKSRKIYYIQDDIEQTIDIEVKPNNDILIFEEPFEIVTSPVYSTSTPKIQSGLLNDIRNNNSVFSFNPNNSPPQLKSPSPKIASVMSLSLKQPTDEYEMIVGTSNQQPSTYFPLFYKKYNQNKLQSLFNNNTCGGQLETSSRYSIFINNARKNHSNKPIEIIDLTD